MNSIFGSDGLIATTLKAYRGTLADNVFKANVFSWILKNAGAKENQDGGTHLVQELMYAQAPNKGSYADDDVFATAPNTGITAAQFDWKQYYGLFSITGIEKAKNSGKPALLKLIKTRIMQLEMTMAAQMESMWFGDGAGNSQKDWTGLGAIVSSSNPSWGNLGGIDRSANPYWQATETAVGGALTLANAGTLYNTVSQGADHPTNILTTQTLYEKYEALVAAKLQLEDTKMGDAGFQNLMFKGAPVAFSDEVTAGEWINLNMQYIHLVSLSNVWFTPSALQQPTNQDAFYQHILCYGNMSVSNPSRQGKLTGAT